MESPTVPRRGPPRAEIATVLLNPTMFCDPLPVLATDLVSCAKVTREKARPGCPTFILVADNNLVHSRVDQLRCHMPNLLIGSFKENQWMLQALDIVVLTPTEARRLAGCISTSSVAAFISAGDAEEELLDVLDTRTFTYVNVGGISNGRGLALPAPPGSPLLPGMLCPGFGDETFTGAMSMFAAGENVLIQEESGVLAFLPGILRMVASGRRQASLFVVPAEEVCAVVQALEAMVDHMGLRQVCVAQCDASTSVLRFHVAVGAPDAVEEALQSKSLTAGLVSQVVLLDTDKLVEDGCLQQVRYTLENTSKSGIQIGLHARKMTAEVKQLARDFLGRYLDIPKYGTTLEDVRQFYVIVGDMREKLSTLQQVWKRLRCRSKVAVYCNSEDSMDYIAGHMHASDGPLLETTQSMSPEQVREEEERFWSINVLLVTNVYTPGTQSIINFELPPSPEEYLRRVGISRDLAFKFVVNLVTEEEAAMLPKFWEVLGTKMDVLPAKYC